MVQKMVSELINVLNNIKSIENNLKAHVEKLLLKHVKFNATHQII